MIGIQELETGCDVVVYTALYSHVCWSKRTYLVPEQEGVAEQEDEWHDKRLGSETWRWRTCTHDGTDGSLVVLSEALCEEKVSTREPDGCFSAMSVLDITHTSVSVGRPIAYPRHHPVPNCCEAGTFLCVTSFLFCQESPAVSSLRIGTSRLYPAQVLQPFSPNPSLPRHQIPSLPLVPARAGVEKT